MNATPVSKEVVKLLSLEHGHKRASELTGVPYDLVRQWSVRGNWKASQTVTKQTVDRAIDVLAERKAQSRSLLSEYQIKAATEAAAHDKPLSITRQVNDLASIHAKVWPEDQTNSNAFTLNVLNMGSLDVEIETPSENE